MRKLLYILLLLPFLGISQGIIVWDTSFETDQWSLTGTEDDTWEYDADKGVPRTTDDNNPNRVGLKGRDGSERAIWLGDYNGHSTRNEIFRDRVMKTTESWVGFSIYVDEPVPGGRAYAQCRNMKQASDPRNDNAAKNPFTLRQHSISDRMYFHLLTDPDKAEAFPEPNGASNGAVTWPKSHPDGGNGFTYKTNDWNDIVIYWDALDYDTDNTLRIWVNGVLIIDHYGVTNYRYMPENSLGQYLEVSGDLKHNIGTYWSSQFPPEGSAYYDDYKIWSGAGGSYADVDPSGGGGTTPPIEVTGAKVWPTSDKMLATGTRQAYFETVPTNATVQTGSWSSDTPAVATVNASTGLITAVGVGSATITWTSDDTTNGTITDTTSITVESSSTEDSIMVLEPQGYYTPSSGDADSWDDTSGFELHGTEVGTITFTDEASFDGASYYDLPDKEFLDYAPTVDEWTVVYREGDTAPFGSGYALSKMDGTADTRQYGVMAYNDGIERFYAGGENESVGVPLLDNNKLVIVIYETNQVNVWIDGENVISNSIAIGSNLAENSPNIGGRTDGSYLMNSGATLDIVATIPKAINSTEREAIETEFQVNGAPTNTSTTPSQINMNGQKTNEFFINGVKYKVTPN